MTEHITNTERMNTFLHAIAEQNEHMKTQQKKEHIKLYGVASEIFEEALIPFLPKIVNYLQRRVKEGETSMHQVLSESIGSVAHHLFKKLDTQDAIDNLNIIMKMLLKNIQSANKNIQVSAGMCLTKLIQNVNVEVLNQILDNLCDRLLELFASHNTKCHTQLLECVISLILAVEDEFIKNAPSFLPFILECMASNDWATRKMAIDVIYTMAAIIKDALTNFREEIMEVLNHSRFDKVKTVREATIEAI